MIDIHIINHGKLLAVTRLPSIPPIGSTVRFYGTGSDLNKMLEGIVDAVIVQCFVKHSDHQPIINLCCTVLEDTLPKEE